ncbi:hypothetical protein G9U51_13470 [Calidifontibacter sp. DB0510]|uniref:Glycosyltransferase RgtA/B/C/D-like domain-containing protein n=1 Tax=Metallococcus carri TaxID=1656884 RepID=A0A967B1W7_9MICO|nr:hypothetical protein [Metallococcus carri]NHN56783.1 hypothetical protein [Metallococcus carri]NOP37840.1 hypothetical protein [Calidifontibacter sp. DB2511S]
MTGRPFGRLFVGSVLAVVVLTHLPGLVYELFDPDEAVLAEQAITLQHGGTLYTDAIDRKPPVPPWIYRGVFDLTGGTDLRWVHLLAALAVGLAALVVASDVSLRTRAARVWAAGLVLAGSVAFTPTNGQAANFAHFALPFGAAAMVLARRPGVRPALLGGVLLALAVGCRQTWILGGLAALWSTARRPRDLAAYLLGAAAGACAVLALSGDPAAMLYWVFAGNGGFVSSAPDAAELAKGLAGNLGLQVLVAHGALLVLAARRWRDREVRDLWVWTLTALVAFVAGWRFYGHYFLQAIPPLAVIAAPVGARLVSRARALTAAAVGIPALVAVGVAFAPGLVRDYPDASRVAAFVAAQTEPQDRVLVWGNLPELFWQANRMPAGGFVTADLVTGRSGNRAPGPTTYAGVPSRAREHFLAALRAHPPAVIVDTSTARLRQYDSYPMSSMPELARLVARDYTPIARIDGMTIYRRTN